jgi:hypothetical protein
MRRGRAGTAVLLLVLAVGCGVRVICALGLDGKLALDGLYVDEVEYSRGIDALCSPPFQRPPGTYLLAWLAGLPAGVAAARILFSIISMVPALAVLRAFGDTGWGKACAVIAAAEPLTAFFGLQVLPAAPAAALLSLSMLQALKGRMAPAGYLVGCAALFRGEVLMALLLYPLLRTGPWRGRVRSFAGLAIPASVAVVPVMALNLASGAGPVLSVNGAENLWLGTDWELASTPPGVEFEALMHLGPGEDSADRHFMRLAVGSIGEAPAGWVLMGLRKEAAFLSVPGPGRNLELGYLLAGTGLSPLLVLTLGLMSLALSRMPGAAGGTPGERLPMALAAAAMAAAFLFIPAARYRTAFFPAMLFLAASRTPSRREVPAFAAVLLLLAAFSILLRYPGSPRTGLTEVQAAQQRLERSEPGEALELLHAASARGYFGADLHNVAGASLMDLGREEEGVAQFEQALGITPDSPSLLRNYAVALWNTGRPDESVRAARMAVELDPLVARDLAPVLEWGRRNLP